MAQITRLTVDSDLNETSVLDACNRLGVTPHGEWLATSAQNWDLAHTIAGKWGMIVVMLPPAMLVSPRAWAVITRTSGMMWSPGVV